MKTIILSAVCIVLAATAVLSMNAGDKAGLFLTLPQGGRPTAMGEAFTGITGDIYCGQWNPAGLADLSSLTMTASLAPTYLDMSYGYLSAALPYRRNTFGLAISYFNYGDLQGWDQNGLNPASFNAMDLGLAMLYARSFPGHKMALGGSLKLLREPIENESATAVMLDAGATKRINRFTLGVSLKNLGSGLKFNSESSGLPVTLSAGGTYYFIDLPLVPAISLDVPFDGHPVISLGAEYSLANYLSLRTGLRTERDQGFASWLRGGFGVNYNGFGVDYAMIPGNELGYTHVVTIGYHK
ncbi:PorV/PorQ family protein [candidate division TA06 bacterium]|uniref:PorV/PorQ family protein n=1 Tax=candidate division TA06 bacterium TaxID=2250710 RepID=A0A933MLB6_UNCT6|nr:PorV/PorQ family protein [candidate division TA06 bacterium]